MKTYHSFSSERTKKLGKEFARQCGAPNVKSKKSRVSALVFALEGELGSGKTTFVQGFLRGLGLRKRSPSPTFIIFRRFTIHASPFKNLYHVDAYRIKNPGELLALGFREIVSDPKNIVLIEWADKIKKVLPRSTYRIRFLYGNRENERVISYPSEVRRRRR